MFLPIQELSPSARVWIYASSKPIPSEVQLRLQSAGELFTSEWTAHQQPLKASFAILHQHIIVFAVEVNFQDISGCGIDKSVRLVQEWEQEFQLGFFNRLQLEYLNEQSELVVVSKKEALSLFEQGKISNATLFVNKTIQTLNELRNELLIPFNKTWAYPITLSQIAE
ncbi:MAG: hypothetical protein MUC81_01800 [Bacteroidia bacterium]|jgi:hypothetical protein|nr:hypothetical protein [Bacteroidia bacterium]